VGNTERRTGSSSQVANTKSQVIDNSASTESRVTPNSANTESLVTQNATSVESHITENSANVENRVMQHSSGGGAGNRNKEKVLPQAKGWLHGGAQGVLPRHKNADCKRCVKESWLRKKKRKSMNIGLIIYSP
jgi:hypothetical protein